MKEINQFKEKLKIEYPCEWPFKLIGADQPSIAHAAKELLPDKKYQLTPSNQSAGGKYVSMSLVITVASEEERTILFEKLKQHPAIKMVL